MHVNGNAATAPTLTIECREDDFDATGPIVARMAPVLNLSRDDLVAALLLSEVGTEDLAVMDAAGVRQHITFALAFYGLNGVHGAVEHERDGRTRHMDADERRHVALCHAKVAEVFGLPAPARPRVACRSLDGRRALVVA